jgi:hypothetical protein
MSALADVLRGRPAHLSPLGCIEDVGWELAGRRARDLPHTIWQLVGHLNYWMDYELRCIEGPEVPAPEHASDGWPRTGGPPDPESWALSIALFRTNLDQLVTLANAQASTLARIVHAAKGTTVEDILVVLAAHNSYHVGQIVQVRQALDAWPPASGEYTW